MVAEPGSEQLRGHLSRRRPLASSALARTEFGRALLPFGQAAGRRGTAVLARVDLVRISDDILDRAAAVAPWTIRSLDAINIATADRVGVDLARMVTYGERMADAARARGWTVVAPA